MSRRPGNPARRLANGGGIPFMHSKSRSSPLLFYWTCGCGGCISDREALINVEDALDYLSPRYLNKALPELARVSAGGFIIFTGNQGQQRAKVAELYKFGRLAKFCSSSWWIRYFLQTSLEENEAAAKKFEQASQKRSYKPACQVFHLKPYA